MDKKRIGIYGGAFNPPTLGHTHVIKSVLEADIVDEIWVMPTFVHFHGKNMAPYDIRVEMCERSFLSEAKLPRDIVKIKKIEGAIADLEPDYDGSTTSMLENLRKHQTHDFRIIIGQDNADTMKTWKNGSELIANEKFIVLPRLQKVPANRDAGWYEYPPHMFLETIEMLDISSTMARGMCKRTDDSDFNVEQLEGVVSDWVVHLIRTNRLYKGGNNE